MLRAARLLVLAAGLWPLGLAAQGTTANAGEAPAAAASPTSDGPPTTRPSEPAAEPAAGHAPTTLVIVGAARPSEREKARIVERLVETAVARSPLLERYDPNPVLLGEEGPGGAARTEAREAMAAGRLAYENLELEDAISHFKEAAKRYAEALPYLDDLGELAEALAFLGAAHFLLGDRERAYQAFGAALRAKPDYEPDRRIFSPPLVEAFEGAKWEYSELPRGKLSVLSRPAGAEVVVDGVVRGATPLVVEDLPTGLHFVVVRDRGRFPVNERAKVTDVDPATLDVALQPGPRTALYESLVEQAVEASGARPQETGQEPAPTARSSALPPALRELSRLFSAERLIFGRLVPEGDRIRLELVGYDVSSGREITRASETVLWGEAGRARLAAFASELLPKVAAPLPAPSEAVALSEPPSPGPGGPAWKPTWWMWAAAGGLLLLAGGGAVLAASSGPSAPAPGAGDGGGERLILLGIP
ncbi:MAG: PEGA domain-containing protein [Deltaproteobacteria bacterium]|nr:MAG: PEGA domain-containing protein [Deltaproteobacteria bacterium]